MSHPPPINVNVTLVQGTAPSTSSLFVSEDEIGLAQSALMQTITWTLHNMPAGFRFPPADDLLHPAFVFPDRQPKPGTFFDPELDKLQFKIHARNRNGSDPGSFIYQLCVTDGNGSYYTTIFDHRPPGTLVGTTGTNRNPKIRNK